MPKKNVSELGAFHKDTIFFKTSTAAVDPRHSKVEVAD